LGDFAPWRTATQDDVAGEEGVHAVAELRGRTTQREEGGVRGVGEDRVEDVRVRRGVEDGEGLRADGRLGGGRLDAALGRGALLSRRLGCLLDRGVGRRSGRGPLDAFAESWYHIVCCQLGLARDTLVLKRGRL
jgi:hypothetical protein